MTEKRAEELTRWRMVNQQHPNIQEMQRIMSQAQAHTAEMGRWFDRVDDAVDRLAYHFGVEVPYSADTEYVRQNEIRWVAPYRLELLEEKIKERYPDPKS